jgi:hypothetical protein
VKSLIVRLGVTGMKKQEESWPVGIIDHPEDTKACIRTSKYLRSENDLAKGMPSSSDIFEEMGPSGPEELISKIRARPVARKRGGRLRGRRLARREANGRKGR